jgi:hypothetical protein
LVAEQLITTTLPKGLKPLIRRMMNVDKYRRPFAHELLTDPVFADRTPGLTHGKINLVYPYPGWAAPTRAANLIRLEQLALQAVVPDTEDEAAQDRQLVGDTVNPALGIFFQAVTLVDQGVTPDIAMFLVSSYIPPEHRNNDKFLVEANAAFEKVNYQVYYETLCSANEGFRGLGGFYLSLIKSPEWVTWSLSDAWDKLLFFTELKTESNIINA